MKELSNTNTHEAKQISNEGSIIIADTIEEFRYASIRMRALESRAGRLNKLILAEMYISS